MLGVNPRPIDREALTGLLTDRASGHTRRRYLREVDRLVSVLVHLQRNPHATMDLRELTVLFPNNPKLNRPESTTPMSRILRWMVGHGVVRRKMLGYQLCWRSNDEFGARILDLLWGR